MWRLVLRLVATVRCHDGDAHASWIRPVPRSAVWSHQRRKDPAYLSEGVEPRFSGIELATIDAGRLRSDQPHPPEMTSNSSWSSAAAPVAMVAHVGR